MDNFFTWEMLATFAGCMAGTIILTEFIKKIWKNAPAQIISFGFALIILVVGQLVTKTFDWNDLVLDVVNAAAVSLSANGGFDAIKGLFGKKASDVGTLILDGTASYISFDDAPDSLEDGEVVKMTVQKVKPE